MSSLLKSRRNFVAYSLGTIALGQSLLARGAFSQTRNTRIADWVGALDQLALNLRTNIISPKEWQLGMDHLYGTIDIKELIVAIDFDQLVASLAFGDRGEVFVPAPFTASSQVPPILNLETRFAGIKQGRCIAPHGHENMVSAFLTLTGEFRTRLFDRVGEDDTYLYVKQTTNELSGPGSWSSISDGHNNVHWLEATTRDSYLFSAKLTDLDPTRRTRGRIPIDHRGEPANNNSLRCLKISSERSREIYR